MKQEYKPGPGWKKLSSVVYQKGMIRIHVSGLIKSMILGTVVNVELTNAALPSLREAELISDYPIVKQDIIAYTYMNHIMELVKSAISDDLNHEKMFQFLEKLFKKMNEGTDSATLSFIFELKLLHFVGYGLNFKG